MKEKRVKKQPNRVNKIRSFTLSEEAVKCIDRIVKSGMADNKSAAVHLAVQRYCNDIGV